MSAKGKRVALMLGWYNYQSHHDIVRYAYRAKWSLDDTMVYRGKPPRGEAFDGLIMSYVGRQDIIDMVVDCGCPAVEISLPVSPLGLPRVGFDDLKIGRQAAAHMSDKGLQTVGYVFERDGVPHPRDVIRCNGLKDELEKRGKRYSEFFLNDLQNQLHSKLFPIGLFVQNDRVAFDLLGRLSEMDIQVPHQAAILGVDNDPTYCDVAEVTLSSVDPGMAERSLEACRLLDHLMNGGSPPNHPILVQPRGVVERMSTKTMGIVHGPTAKAYSVLSSNYLDHELTPTQVAENVGITRCQLDKQFNRYVGRSISAELLRLRLERVQHLLRTTDLKMYEIAEATAFGSPEYMAYAFRKSFDCPPRAYRAANQRTNHRLAPSAFTSDDGSAARDSCTPEGASRRRV